MNSSLPEVFCTLSRMSAEFGYLIDHGRALDCAELFSSNARLIFGPGSPCPATFGGMEEILGFLTARQAQTHVTTRHLASNFRLEWAGGAEATLESLLTLFRSDNEKRTPTVSVVADVRELFTRGEEDRWRIQERLTTPVFALS